MRALLKVDAALIYDAVKLYVKAALEILDTEEKREQPPLSCSSQGAWPHGFSIINYMKLVSAPHLYTILCSKRSIKSLQPIFHFSIEKCT